VTNFYIFMKRIIKDLTYIFFCVRIYTINNIVFRKDETIMAEDTWLTDEQIEKKKKWAAIWDKVTTGLLIFLMTSPILILAYIFLWFIFR
jgi:hypothetical protein